MIPSDPSKRPIASRLLAHLPCLGERAPDGFLVQPVHRLVEGLLIGIEASKPRACPGQDGAVASLVQQACYAATSWCGSPGGRVLTVSVRLPVGSVLDRHFVAQVEAVLEETGRPPNAFELGLDGAELEEACADRLLALSALRDLGVGIALGNVAGAPASLRRARRVPLTCLRLHPAVASLLERSRDARRGAAAAIRAAHAVDAEVVATNVASPIQRDILADLSCDGAQGPLFGPPMPAEQFRSSLLPSFKKEVLF